LLHVLRIVIRADSDPARQALFANLLKSRWWVRIAFMLHNRLPASWGTTLLFGCYAPVSLAGVAPPPLRGARVLTIAVHANARRQIDRVCAWIGEPRCTRVRIGRLALLSGSALAALASSAWRGRPSRVLRIAGRVDRRHGMLVALRVVRAITWYARARTILRTHRPGAILVSSDSNPEELAFVAAARVLGIPQLFVAHAYPTPLSPPLEFTLSILEGTAAVAARRARGAIAGAVVLGGVEGDSRPLDVSRFERRAPVIGVFPPKAVAWPTLSTIIDDCRRHFGARQIVIRWHPSMLEKPRLGDFIADRAGIVEASSTVAVAEVARQCDWVVADENSNVHLPVLKLGIPTVAVKHLGIYPSSREDQYRFAANGIVFPPVSSIRDVDPAAFQAFFSEAWSRRFAEYDVSYLRADAEVAHEVRAAIDAAIERRPLAAV
jgi:hypothetical protein